MTDIKELAARLHTFGVTSQLILREDIHEAANLLLHLQEQCENWELDYTWASKRAVDAEDNYALAKIRIETLEAEVSRLRTLVNIEEVRRKNAEEELERLKHLQAESSWREEYRRNMNV